MTKPKIQKIHFPLLLFEHQYLAYYDNLTDETFNTYSQHSSLVNCVSDLLFRAYFLFYKI